MLPAGYSGTQLVRKAERDEPKLLDVGRDAWRDGAFPFELGDGPVRSGVAVGERALGHRAELRIHRRRPTKRGASVVGAGRQLGRLLDAVRLHETPSLRPEAVALRCRPDSTCRSTVSQHRDMRFATRAAGLSAKGLQAASTARDTDGSGDQAILFHVR